MTVVVEAIRHLFPLVTEHQSRELARRVLRTLAGRGVALATAREQDPPEPLP